MKFPKRHRRHFDLFAFGLAGVLAGIVGLSLMGILMSGLGIISFSEFFTKKASTQYFLIVICLASVGSIITWIVGYRYLANLLKILEKAEKPKALEPEDTKNPK